MTKNPDLHGRTKHIDIRYHFIQNLVARGIMALKLCNIGEQVVVILTKSLSREKHAYFRL